MQMVVRVITRDGEKIFRLVEEWETSFTSEADYEKQEIPERDALLHGTEVETIYALYTMYKRKPKPWELLRAIVLLGAIDEEKAVITAKYLLKTLMGTDAHVLLHMYSIGSMIDAAEELGCPDMVRVEWTRDGLPVGIAGVNVGPFDAEEFEDCAFSWNTVHFIGWCMQGSITLS